MRLIDADALLLNVGCPNFGYGNYYQGIDSERRRCIELIEEAPTIEPDDKRAHGYWIPVQAIVGLDPVTMNVKFGDADRCSNCKVDFVSVPVKYRFCPNCGAIMDMEAPHKS